MVISQRSSSVQRNIVQFRSSSSFANSIITFYVPLTPLTSISILCSYFSIVLSIEWIKNGLQTRELCWTDMKFKSVCVCVYEEKKNERNRIDMALKINLFFFAIHMILKQIPLSLLYHWIMIIVFGMSLCILLQIIIFFFRIFLSTVFYKCLYEMIWFGMR